MKKSLKLILPMILITLSFTGCASLKNEMLEAMENHVDIELSVEENSYDVTRNNISWVELDQLSTYKNLRQSWDYELNIIKFDVNSKNGSIFVDTEGNWAGNNTLYNVFQNKVFVEDYWGDSQVRSALAQLAVKEFTDIEREGTGLPASVNAYFNIFPTNMNESSGMFNYITRAEAMQALYKGDTPVILLEENEDFRNAVGNSDFNIYAQNVTDCSYLDYRNSSLNQYTYNSTITRAEGIYMIVLRLFKDDYDATTGKESGLSDCKNAGRVADKLGFTDKYAWQAYELEYCLQNTDKGVTEDLYRALIVAKDKGLIASDSRWSDGMMAGEFLNMLMTAYNNVQTGNIFMVNAKAGANAGQSLIVEEEPADEEKPVQNEEIQTTVVVQKIKDISSIDKLISVYGDELDMTNAEIEDAKKIAEGFTIEAVDKYMLVDFCGYLNVRTGPSTDYTIKKSVPKGTQVHIVGRCVENGWYRVIADGQISYQCGIYFSDLPGQDTSNLVQEYED